MQATPLAIPEVILLTPRIFDDARGFFYESFNQQAFEQAVGHSGYFVQDNHSRSEQGVLRGLHYQLPPHAQGKLVRVVHGEIYDVAVDLRAGSPTLGQWVGARLSAQNHRQLWVPAGFAHGFLTLSAHADVVYKTTAFYAPESERCIAWNDASLAIDWPVDVIAGAPLVSNKDARGVSFSDAILFPSSD